MKRYIISIIISLILIMQNTIVYASSNNINESNTIPSSFDLRDVNGTNYVTSSKYQGTYGTCYAFSANGAIESGLLVKGLVNKDIDISEASLVYYSNYRNGTEDKQGNTNGDISNYLPTDTYHSGGTALDALYTYGNWIGPINESIWSYSNIEYNKSKNIADTLTAPYTKDIAHLENGYTISIKDHQNEIKQMLMTYGAISFPLRIDSNYMKKFPSGNASINNPNELVTNHDVQLIGWNDNYSKDNFVVKPKNDGAWIVKNSWGTNCPYIYISYEDCCTNNQNAYIFDIESVNNYDNIYQYDGTANNNYAFLNNGATIAHIYNVTNSNELLKAFSLYIWDENVSYKVQIYKNPNNVDPISGILMLSDIGTIKYAGFNTISLSKSIPLLAGDTFSIVVSLNNPNNYYTSISAEHSFNDKSCIDGSLKEGQVFYKEQNDKSFYDMYTYNNQSSLKNKWTFRLKAYTINSNCNFSNTIYNKPTCSKKGKYEIKCVNHCNYFYSIDIPTIDHSFTRKNPIQKALRTKATIDSPATYYYSCEYCDTIDKSSKNYFTYGKPLDDIKITDINLDSSNITLTKNDLLYLNVNITPINVKNNNLKWTSSNSKIVKVFDDGLIQAKKVGKAIITVESTDGSNIKATCKVTVKPLVKSIKVNKKIIKLKKGKTFKIKAKCLPTSSLQKISYKSKNKKIATVTSKGVIKAKKKGTTYIICKAKDNSNKKVTIKIIVK